MASSARIDELRKKFEENPRRYFAPLANEYRKAGEIDRAIAICREYLPQQPGHMSGHIVFGQALYEARQFEEAKTVFETALSLDPENLIALRHLGDIALIIGDSDAARGWYGRVLEADPRNEEIQAQLATLDKAASTAPTPAITPAIPSTPTAPPAVAKPMPSSAPTVVMKAMAPPARPVTATSPTAEIRLDEIIPAVDSGPPEAAEQPPEFSPTSITDSAMGSSEGPSAVPSAALEGLEATSAGGAAETAMDSFSLEGLETTSMSASPPPPVETAPEPLPDLDFGTPSEPPPPAPMALPAVPTLDLDISVAAPESLDLDFGAIAASAPPPVPAVTQAAAPTMAPAAGAAEEAPLDLELSLPSAPAAPAVPAPPLVETRAVVAATELAMEEVEDGPAVVSESGPFVTETMAELYLQQGHRDEALRVYRALADQRPADTALREKLNWLEAELARPPSAIDHPSPTPAAFPAFGPTMRALLTAIALRRPGYRAEMPRGNGAAQVGAALPSESGLAGPEMDNLGLALGFGRPSELDDSVAIALSQAFSANGQSANEPLIAGVPARPAATELSLETVFKDGEAPAPSNFSFDQFFSQRASAEHSSPGAPDASALESPAEVAKFTQWLEGLKRR